ncbi:coiled-coil domain-containing protein [Rufibacter latericius]|uniref:J domain-containing protein n=1 Tax=Rufibacter latericius TaxID=2487040 RepID=A0A3M9M8G9_9BACT|nr:J domain-containing protein [Rufibacter latericius]RNI21861.1 J domain-containing protein [Rufibacter latericius]
MSEKENPESPHLPQFTPQEKVSLSELQQQFNASIQTIDHLKAQLAERAKIIEMARVRVQKEVQPLVQEMVKRRVALVHLLDEALHQEDFPRLEKEKLTGFIKDQASTLVHNYHAEELTELLQRYTHPQPTSEQENNATKAETQNLLKNVLGLDVNLEDLSDLQSFQARLEQQMQEEQDRREAQRLHRQKSKAQQAKEAKLKAQLQNISKASRRLYTTLAKLLHPDRERDAAAQVWKEEAMKKVTIAYHQDDFFELLRLQMEFMHEQEQLLAQVPEDQLTYYVHLLREQIQDMEDEHSNYYMSPDAQLYQEFGGTPKQMEAKFRNAKKGLREEIQQLDFALTDFKEVDSVRDFLKRL